MCNDVDQGSKAKKKQRGVPKPAAAAKPEESRCQVPASGAKRTKGQGKQKPNSKGKPNKAQDAKGKKHGENKEQNETQSQNVTHETHQTQNLETEQRGPEEVLNEVTRCEVPEGKAATEEKNEENNEQNENQIQDLETEQEDPHMENQSQNELKGESKEEEEKEEMKDISVFAAIPENPQPNVKDSLTEDESLVYYTQDPTEYYYSTEN